jgi:preprotein translocase subunit SecY
MRSRAIKIGVIALAVILALAVMGYALMLLGKGHAVNTQEALLPVGLIIGAIGVVVAMYVALFRQVAMFKAFRTLVFMVVGLVALGLVVDAGNEIYARVVAARATAGGFQADQLTSPLTKVIGAAALMILLYFGLVAHTAARRIVENIFSIPELLKKLAFTVGLLCIYRIGYHIPLPGISPEAITGFMQTQEKGSLGRALQYFTMFSGGNLSQTTLFGLGIMPYISAAIILQLLVTVVPTLAKLQKEGQAGYRKIQEYTRYLTVVLCVMQAGFWMGVVRSNNLLYHNYQGSVGVYMMIVLGLTAGTMFLMWLGEQIDEYGIGNGISLIIMAGIVSRLPNAIFQLISSSSVKVTSGTGDIGIIKIIFLVAAFVVVVAGSILITQAQRRIPIQQAKQTRGRRVYGGQRQYLPLRVNHGGVMPIIFASSLLLFPGVITNWLQSVWPNSDLMRQISSSLQPGKLIHELLYVGLIFFFAYFWTTVQFRPKDMSENLQDYGSFIPGLRPGRRTAEYLERVMERITYCGAGFLAAIAVIPQVIAGSMNIPWQISSFLGGTGLLITVSVALDLVQRIESNLIMRNYGGFLGDSARIKGAYA